VIERFGGYAEVSPSGTGAKVFFRYCSADLRRLRGIMGTAQHGKMFKRGRGDHPPAIELHVSNRYFAVTGKAIDPDRIELRFVGLVQLKWLLAEAGPAFAGKASKKPSAGSNFVSDDPRDNSRSGAAFRLGMRMRRASTDFEAFRETVSTDPETAE
jgi:putative DNA primase/helicase